MISWHKQSQDMKSPDDNFAVRVGRYLAFVLRHKPESIGLQLDDQGWAKIQDIIAKSTTIDLDENIINHVVATNDKNRYEISEDGTSIRARQGHSFDVNLGLKELEPPNILYHGTAAKNADLIYKQGILKMNRQYVHLSDSINTAYQVGKRHGKPLVLTIDAKRMYNENITFYQSSNGVWLCDHVPAKYFV